MSCRLTSAAVIFALIGGLVPAAGDDAGVEQLVARHMRGLLPANGAGGAAVAVRMDGRTLFFNYGYADRAANRPVTSDSLFNLGSVAKVFDAVLLAQAVQQGELAFNDPVAKHVVELQRGGDIRRVTLRQLASFTSGLVLPQDHPPWTAKTFDSPAEFIAALNAWQAEEGRQPGQQVIHTHSNYMVLRLALERRFAMPMNELLRQRLFEPLGLVSTAAPVPPADAQHPRGRLPPTLRSRAAQGYDTDGSPAGEPGDLQGFYHWVGTGQMYSSARDMAVMLAANLGELPDHSTLQRAMKLAQQGVLPFGKGSVTALAWESHRQQGWEIVERYGGLNNATATMAMIPERRLGIVILCNRSEDVATAGQNILLELAAR